MAMDNELAVDIIQSVGRYWSDNELSDCRISVDGQVFQASRFHLSACSEFFRQVFHTESITHKENIVIKGISADVFSCVIKALFTGVVGLDESNMVDVWLAASYLKIDFLVKKSEQFIEEHLTAQNYLQLYKGLFIVSSAAVINKIIRLMAQDFDMFRLTDTFLNLPSEMLIKVVESGEIKSQDSLVESVLKWASHVPDYEVETFGLQLYHDFQDLMEKHCDDCSVTFGFSKDNVCQFVADEVARSQILGQLIKKVKLGELSETGLKMIYEDELTLKHQDVKDVVILELAARVLYRTDNKTVAVYQKTQPDSSTSDLSLTNEEIKDKQLAKTTDVALKEFNLLDLECYDIFEVPDWVVTGYSKIHIHSKSKALEDIVVFSTNHTFVMYSFEKKHFFKLFDSKETETIKHFYVFENNLYYITQVDGKNLATLEIICPNQAISICKSSIDISTSVYLKYFIAFPFIFKFKLAKANLEVYMRERTNNWTCIQNIILSNSRDPYFTFYCILSMGNNIIFFLTGKETQIVYFDLNTHKVHTVYSVKQKIVNYKIYEMSQRYFMLFGSGQLFEIVHRKRISIIFRQLLWKGTLNMHGVFFFKIGDCDILYVFTDKTSNVQRLVKNLKIEVVVVGSICNRQCEFIKVERDWLNQSLIL